MRVVYLCSSQVVWPPGTLPQDPMAAAVRTGHCAAGLSTTDPDGQRAITGKTLELCCRAWISAQLHINCVAPGKLLKRSVPQFTHPWAEASQSTCSLRLWELNDNKVLGARCLTQVTPHGRNNSRSVGCCSYKMGCGEARFAFHGL